MFPIDRTQQDFMNLVRAMALVNNVIQPQPQPQQPQQPQSRIQNRLLALFPFAQSPRFTSPVPGPVSNPSVSMENEEPIIEAQEEQDYIPLPVESLMGGYSLFNPFPAIERSIPRPRQRTAQISRVNSIFGVYPDPEPDTELYQNRDQEQESEIELPPLESVYEYRRENRRGEQRRNRMYEIEVEMNAFDSIFDSRFLSAIFGGSSRSQFDNETYSLTRDSVYQYVKTWFRGDEASISENLLKTVFSLWTKSKSGEFPTLDELTDHYKDSLCQCRYHYSEHQNREFTKHCLVYAGRLLSCSESELAEEYRLIENRYPTMEELLEQRIRMLEFYIDPEQYHEKYKNHVPVPNLDKLLPIELEEKEKDCAICLGDMVKGDKCFKLSCGHYFHSEKEECLGDFNIINWLSKNRQCPVCKSEVYVEVDKKADKKKTDIETELNYKENNNNKMAD